MLLTPTHPEHFWLDTDMVSETLRSELQRLWQVSAKPMGKAGRSEANSSSSRESGASTTATATNTTKRNLGTRGFPLLDSAHQVFSLTV
mmetsp:Transcript_61370/g.163199  ORF Transcript_61370/g.163199 Transcript_61370/m.163199 type:complete len:89 (+) Transcript_61370:44-310(+)